MLVQYIVYFEPPVNSSTMQYFHFPGLSMARKINEKIPDSLEGVETLAGCSCSSSKNHTDRKGYTVHR